MVCVLVTGAGLVVSQNAYAAPKKNGNIPCDTVYLTSGKMKVYSLVLRDGSCMATVGLAVKGQKYRQFLFDSNGMMMVFIGTQGNLSSATGARSYYLFPRAAKGGARLMVGQTRKGELTVDVPGVRRIVFAANEAKITEFEGAEVSQDPALNLSNNGGVEIASFKGILLDTGWRVGEAAFADRSRTSVFRDYFGNTCEVRNTEVFSYPTRYDAILKFRDDASLESFLANRCPNLSSLEASVHPVAP
jgi:hypothetical protein